jgi:protein-tyrosine-phosphatase
MANEGGPAAPEVLFVCTGNTCRSALAEAFWRVLAPGAPVGSAGTSAWPGAAPSTEAVLVAASRGGDLAGHRARRLADVRSDPDHVYTMTARQRDDVLAQRPEWEGRVELLTEAVGEAGDIPDPMGQSAEAYEDLGRRLWPLVDKLAKRLLADGEPPVVGGEESGTL